MRCDLARRLLSDRLDGELGPEEHAAVDTHVASCPSCAAFASEAGELRRRLRVSLLEPPPDIAPAVRAELERRDRRWSPARPRPQWPASELLRAAAVFVVAFAVTATTIGLTGPREAAAVEVDRLVRSGQHEVEALTAEVTITEHGWHPQVPTRRYDGSLAYLAPERFALTLTDRSAYPSDGWRRNDVELAVDGSRAWSRGLVGCPLSALPGCAREPQVRAVTGREPFDESEPIPLEVVVPVASFGVPAGHLLAPSTRVDGRDAVVLEVTVAQVQGVLDGFTSVGAWRDLHPSDPVEVALDAEHGIPLSLVVRAADTDERRRWSATNGYRDAAGSVLLTWQLTEVLVNEPGAVPEPVEAPGSPDVVTDRGFAPTDANEALARPDRLALHQVGHSGPVRIEAWTDGRAWLQLRVHQAWGGDRLFGRRGDLLVQRVTLGTGAMAYLAEGGGELFLHTPDADLHLRGSVGSRALLEVAADLDLEGLAVPRTWAEASSASVADAREALPGLLEPDVIPGFLGPSVRVRGDVVSLAYAGNGQRAFVLTQAPGQLLSPPLDADVIGLSVRDAVGRFTPSTATLEWVEGAMVVSLRSDSLSLGELLAVAERLAQRS
ncbi:MAG TPA: zf-HC2 domain-containing protein [Nitriliruptorales bacterium]